MGSLDLMSDAAGWASPWIFHNNWKGNQGHTTTFSAVPNRDPNGHYSESSSTSPSTTVSVSTTVGFGFFGFLVLAGLEIFLLAAYEGPLIMDQLSPKTSRGLEPFRVLDPEPSPLEHLVLVP